MKFNRTNEYIRYLDSKAIVRQYQYHSLFMTPETDWELWWSAPVPVYPLSAYLTSHQMTRSPRFLLHIYILCAVRHLQRANHRPDPNIS